jgi:hypothetical protein
MRSTYRWVPRVSVLALGVVVLGLSLGAVKSAAPPDTIAFVGGMIVDGTGAPA